MRREQDWKNITKITSERSTCIAQGGSNFNKAQWDFEQFNGQIRYYSFPVEHSRRGYLRTIYDKDNAALYVDFLTPWSGEVAGQAITYLAHKFADIASVYIPQDQLPEPLKGQPYEVENRVLPAFSKNLRHRTYYNVTERICVRIRGLF